MKSRLLFFFSVSLLSSTPWLFGCPPNPVNPESETDGGDAPDSDESRSATCSKWCAHAAQLGCPSAKPTPQGASCTTVCENMQSSGVTRWNLSCRVKARSCTIADSCEN